MVEYQLSRRFLGIAIDIDTAPEDGSVSDLETIIDRARERGLETAIGTDLKASLATLSAQCLLSAPPADISIVTDAAGKLIFQCSHKTPHSWPL